MVSILFQITCIEVQSHCIQLPVCLAHHTGPAAARLTVLTSSLKLLEYLVCRGVNVLAKFRGGRSFTLTHVAIRAPREGFTSPLGQGLLFVSWGKLEIVLFRKPKLSYWGGMLSMHLKGRVLMLTSWPGLG